MDTFIFGITLPQLDCNASTELHATYWPFSLEISDKNITQYIQHVINRLIQYIWTTFKQITTPIQYKTSGLHSNI
jgi:hypothetical protein